MYIQNIKRNGRKLKSRVPEDSKLRKLTSKFSLAKEWETGLQRTMKSLEESMSGRRRTGRAAGRARRRTDADYTQSERNPDRPAHLAAKY